jgi:hypothetical protein
MKVELEPGEVEVGNWILNLRPSSGGVLSGKMTVTNTRLLFEAKSDISVSGLVDRMGVIAGGKPGLLAIRKADIRDIALNKSFLRKQFVVVLADGATLAFDRGVMSIEAVLDAVRAR